VSTLKFHNYRIRAENVLEGFAYPPTTAQWRFNPHPETRLALHALAFLSLLFNAMTQIKGRL
jgi:hypothetical protein